MTRSYPPPPPDLRRGAALVTAVAGLVFVAAFFSAGFLAAGFLRAGAATAWLGFFRVGTCGLPMRRAEMTTPIRHRPSSQGGQGAVVARGGIATIARLG